MLSRWLDKKMAKVQKEEAEQFLLMLKGANSDVIADIASKTIVAAALIQEGKGYDLYQVAHWADQFPMAAAHLGSEIKQFQREGKPGHAVGYMAWLHTTRAASFPELKFVARQIWDELDRAPRRHIAFRRAGASADDQGLFLQGEAGQRPDDFDGI
jgi:hypothetical protein